MNKREASIRDLPVLLKDFLKHPIGFMRQPLTLSWPAIASLQIGAAAVSGALVGLMGRNFLDFLTGLFLFPLTTLVISAVFTLFIYYFFSLFRATFLELRRLMGIVTFALVPYLIFHTVSAFLPPIDLLGFAFTCALLAVGLVEQFGLERKIVFKLVGACGLVFFLAWSTAQIRAGLIVPKGQETQARPRALDEIQAEGSH